MAGIAQGLFRVTRPWGRAAACGICFGVAGLVWSLPGIRKRRLDRAAHCRTCRGHARVRTFAVALVSVLLVAGAAARAQTVLVPQIVCHSHISADGDIEPEPLLRIEPPMGWDIARSVLVAPISGVGVLTGWTLRMESCSGPPLLVMFWLPPRVSGGGTTLGDVFVAWMPPKGSTTGALSNRGYVITSEGTYLRYGPNISQTRVNEAALGLHESRHVDQWAVGTLLAGPFAFPVAYAVDGTVFPGSRNHFERDAGLTRGGYTPAPDAQPAPLWPESLVLCAVGVLLFRRRLRWLTRVVRGGRPQLRAHAPQHCPVHTPGWKPCPDVGVSPDAPGRGV